MSGVTTTITPTGTKQNKFEGDGVPFKGKLIGMEDVPVDRDEKACLDSLFKLKAVATARKEHKQKLQLNLTMAGIKVYDDTTKVIIASHEVERISFVVMDPRDARAFGYIYNTSDDRHQFWAIKTERTAATTVYALKELFEIAFEQFTNAEKENQTTSAPVSPEVERISFVVMDPRDARAFGYIYNTSDDRHQFWAIKTERTAATTVYALKELFEIAFEQFTNAEKENQTTSAPVSPTDVTVSVQQTPSQSTPVPTPQPSLQPPPPVPQRTEPPASSLLGDIWGDSPTVTLPQPPIQTIQQPSIQTVQQPPVQTIQKQSIPELDLWGNNEPAVPVQQPASRVEDPLGDMFGLLGSPSPPPPPPPARPTPQQPTSTTGTNDFLSMFTPAQPTPNVNTNMFAQPVQQTPFIPQQQQQTPFIAQQQQQNFMNPTPIMPVSPPAVTNSTSGFDLLGDFS
ncbi:unnamed protein product [Adineta steineri]|uniref:PID domain-containing protein n=1 Tax=Adineta steineri TaxID=433720 RepID=A0A814XSZ0_9BILA|nr:unnamed protein product [Adineta steineri]